MPFPTTPGLTAGSNIAPMSFAVMSTVNDFEIIQSGLNGRALFVTQQYMQQPPGLPGSDQTIAASGPSTLMPYGWPIAVYVVGDVAKLRVSSTVTRGDGLKSDANGWGQTAVSGDVICAYALESGTQSQIITVFVQTPVKL